MKNIYLILIILLLSSCVVLKKQQKIEYFIGKVVVSNFTDTDTTYYIDTVSLHYDLTNYQQGIDLKYISKEYQYDLWLERVATHSYFVEDNDYVYMITIPTSKERKEGILLCIEHLNKEYTRFKTTIIAGKAYKL